MQCSTSIDDVPEVAISALVFALAESLHAGVDDLHSLDVGRDDVPDEHRREVQRVLLRHVFASGQKHFGLDALKLRFETVGIRERATFNVFRKVQNISSFLFPLSVCLSLPLALSTFCLLVLSTFGPPLSLSLVLSTFCLSCYFYLMSLFVSPSHLFFQLSVCLAMST